MYTLLSLQQYRTGAVYSTRYCLSKCARGASMRDADARGRARCTLPAPRPRGSDYITQTNVYQESAMRSDDPLAGSAPRGSGAKIGTLGASA